MQGDVERAMWAVTEAVVAYERTKDPAVLTRLADDATATARLYENNAYEKALISAPEVPGDPRDAADVRDVLARLRSSN